MSHDVATWMTVGLVGEQRPGTKRCMGGDGASAVAAQMFMAEAAAPSQTAGGRHSSHKSEEWHSQKSRSLRLPVCIEPGTVMWWVPRGCSGDRDATALHDFSMAEGIDLLEAMRILPMSPCIKVAWRLTQGGANRHQ